jgi:phenylalanyl-tRNA synthetase beta chain
MVVGLTRAWARNAERGNGDIALFEIGTLATHPEASANPRRDRGGVGGVLELALPVEREILTAVLCRPEDSAETAVASWHVLAERLGLRETEFVKGDAPTGWHPTRFTEVRDTATGVLVARIGEAHPRVVGDIALQQFADRRVGLLEVDCDVIADGALVLRRDVHVAIPSRFPTASFDLALVTPVEVPRQTLQRRLAAAHELVESVTFFDVYRGSQLPVGTRSLTFTIRLSSNDRTLTDGDILEGRTALLDAAAAVGATLR